MFGINVTINGKPLTAENVQSELEKEVIAGIANHINSKLSGVPRELNGEVLEIALEGADLENLSVRLTGPDELIAQAKAALESE